MPDLERLLDVQGLDTRADQLRHRHDTLAERAALADARAALAAMEQAHAATTRRRDELAAQQDHLEAEIGTARERIATVERTLYGRTTSNPRELQALQDEIASLTRRVSLLEDDELGVMEQLEPVEVEVATATVEGDRLSADIERLEAEVTAAETEIDVELDAVDEARKGVAADVPAPLLDEYEHIRSRSGGVGVARLVGGQCGGCHMRLPAVELDRIKKQADDALVHCDDCGRILVR